MCAAHYQMVRQKDDYVLYEYTSSAPLERAADATWSGFLLCQTAGPVLASLSFEAAWSDYPGAPMQGVNGGCYLFCRAAPGDADLFMANVQGLLASMLGDGGTAAYRYLMWLLDTDASSPDALLAQCLPFVTATAPSTAGTIVNQVKGPTRFNAVSFGSIYLQLNPGVSIVADAASQTLRFTNFSGSIELWNSNGAQQFGVVGPTVTLALGEGAGTLKLAAIFDTNSVNGNDFVQMEAGLRYFKPDGAGGADAQAYPLWRPIPGKASYQMSVSLAPLWPECPERTYFEFAAPVPPAASMGAFPSWLATPNGNAIWLTPVSAQARLCMMYGIVQGDNLKRDATDLLYLAPAGDFVLGKVDDDQPVLMCGLSATENLSFEPQSLTEPGFILRFTPHMAAYAPQFPLKSASPLDAPLDPQAPLLNRTLTTSWLSLRSAGALGEPRYTALPKGFSLYGRDARIFHADPQFLGLTAPSTPYHAGDAGDDGCFPVAPYACLQPAQAWSKSDIQTFEREILAPSRRLAIAQVSTQPSRLLNAMADGAAPTQVTTPSGQTVTLDQQSGWQQILLGQVRPPALGQQPLREEEGDQMAFQQPSNELVQAFTTSDLLLVVANPQFLGESAGNFKNSLTIEQWQLAAEVGASCSYGDYANIVIVKGRRGKLYCPKQALEDNLVATPDKWTQRADFAAPNGQVDELVPLAQWLSDYFLDAAQRGADANDPDALYFQQFNRIASAEDWTGVLVLRAKIASLPEQMQGILAGVADPAAFYCHHFAVEVSQTKNGADGPAMAGSSAVYGLIYYRDPAFDGTAPVAPAPGADYDFRLLSLKVLFDNTAVKRFQSYAQVTFNLLFGSTVSGMGDGGNDYNSIILQGGFQENGGMPVYSLGTVRDYQFQLENNVLNKIEIVSTQMHTVSTTPEATDILFSLSGYIDFKILTSGTSAGTSAGTIAGTGTGDDPPDAIDLFSFGSMDGRTPRQGLSFSNLGLRMSFAAATPQNRTFTFITDNISFDIDSSTIREGSLYRSFALELSGLKQGDAASTPAQQGYLDIITDLRLSGVDDGAWSGLSFRLNLGTPGQLAGKLGLNAHLLLAWSGQGGSGQDYQVQAALSLPGTTDGASMFSLQNVLKLSFGPIRLVYVPDSRKDGKRHFMLLLTDIALKFLGMAKIPPNGASTFYLFGNPDSGGKPGGLGWYARYQQDSEPAAILPPAPHQEH